MPSALSSPLPVADQQSESLLVFLLSPPMMLFARFELLDGLTGDVEQPSHFGCSDVVL